jgi:uncharacterized membrane protein YfcA
MHFEWIYVVSGLLVGFIVGMTGVGGGSLMTPILLHFGIAPSAAVGTDLLYAAVTKAGGVFVHNKHNNINWRITGWLALGSLPASAATLLAMQQIGFSSSSMNAFIKTMLGFALVFTALAIIFKKALLNYSHRNDIWITRMSQSQQDIATVMVGVLLGTIVTITSIGAGAVGTVALFLLYPLLPTNKLVGTEIAHAVPLTLLAGLGHAGFGNLNLPLLGNLLLGSLPGIYLGSHLANNVADHYLRPALAAILLFTGGKLIM